MKPFLGIILSLFIFSCVSKKNISSPSPSGIKKITEAFYAASEKNIDREIALKSRILKITFYNQNGSIIENHKYYLEDSISYLNKKEVISYDKNDKPIKGEVYDKDNELIEYWLTKLNKNGNVVEYKTYGNP